MSTPISADQFHIRPAQPKLSDRQIDYLNEMIEESWDRIKGFAVVQLPFWFIDGYPLDLLVNAIRQTYRLDGGEGGLR